MIDWHMALTDGLFILATLAMTVSVAGILRLPSSYAKIHAAATAVVFASVALIACALAGGWVILFRALLVMLFMLITAPVAAHSLARLESKMQNDSVTWRTIPAAEQEDRDMDAAPR